MSDLIYHALRRSERPIVWLAGEIKSPPFTRGGRRRAGWLLRRLQFGERLGMPHSRSMSVIGARCHELRIADDSVEWRIVYRADPDAIVVLAVFAKATRQTPENVVAQCRNRLRRYDAQRS